jgi:rhomboid protease GluP
VQILMGGAVERNLGHIRYLFLYLVSGIGGNVVSVLYDRVQGVNTYSVGASGAVFGVMGTLIILILRGRKKLRSGSSLLPRAAFAVFYAVYSGFRNPYTDNAAHLGGLLFGMALGTLLTVTLEDVDLQDLR